MNYYGLLYLSPSDHTPYLLLIRCLVTRPCPNLPPKPMCTPCSFEQKISDKVYKNLVFKNKVPTFTMTECSASKCSTTTASASSLKVKVASALAKMDLDLSIPSELVDDDVIVTGKKHKMLFLQEYEAEFGGDTPKSTVTRKKGKHSHETDNITPTRMLPSIRKYYRFQELTLYNVITTVIKEYRDSLTATDVIHLSQINRDFSVMIPNTIRWLQLDFSPLREP
jgi:hypothetical protein